MQKFACLALPVFFAAGLGAQSPVIGIWKFDETAGLTAADSGPLGNNGNLVNFFNDPAQWVPGRFGNALQFDGTANYVDLPVGNGIPFYDGLGASFSIAFWVNGQPQEDDRFIALSSSTANEPLFCLGSGRNSQSNQGSLQLFLRNDQNRNIERYSDGVILDGTWHHVCYTETSGAGRLYIDGVQDTASFDLRGIATNYSAYGTFTFDQLTIGAITRQSPCCHFTGELDEFHVFGFAVSQADVMTLMNGGALGNCRGSIGSYGVGCGPGPLDLFTSGSPVIGGPGLSFSALGGSPNASLLLCIGVGPMAPLDLAALGIPGCTLYQPSGSCIPAGSLNAFGSNTGVPLGVPNSPGLACVRAGFQFIALGANGPELSNAGVVVFGM